jgi:hypothetical protein
MYNRQFRFGDKVSYAGEKFAKELRGKLGIVDATVGNSETEVVVDFGEDQFVMSELNLRPFQEKVDVSKELEVRKKHRRNTEED